MMHAIPFKLLRCTPRQKYRAQLGSAADKFDTHAHLPPCMTQPHTRCGVCNQGSEEKWATAAHLARNCCGLCTQQDSSQKSCLLSQGFSQISKPDFCVDSQSLLNWSLPYGVISLGSLQYRSSSTMDDTKVWNL